MQITDKDIQQFRERAKIELQSNGAVGRLAWDAVVNALCNEVEELRKNATISNAVDSAWAGVCAACAEGTPPERCAYYGDPDGCNAPILGKHPEGNLAERLQEALEKAERRIAELERASGNAAAMRAALERLLRFLQWMYAQEGRSADVGRDRLSDEIDVAVSALAAPARNCDRFDCVCTAQREFRRAFRDPYSNPAPSGDDPAYWPLVVNWLFATAEGGEK